MDDRNGRHSTSSVYDAVASSAERFDHANCTPKLIVAHQRGTRTRASSTPQGFAAKIDALCSRRRRRRSACPSMASYLGTPSPPPALPPPPPLLPPGYSRVDFLFTPSGVVATSVGGTLCMCFFCFCCWKVGWRCIDWTLRHGNSSQFRSHKGSRTQRV